ncbi:MAG: PEP-CTERM sorting domain-containing protein [Pseudomonadales bacterium]|jgi:hypothetical protein
MRAPRILKFFITAALSFVMAVPVYAATVAVIGSRFEMQVVADAFSNDFGDTATRYNSGWSGLSEAQLDEIFSADIVWEADVFASIPANVQSRMQNFVDNNGGLFLTAERPCCELHNDSIQALARTLTGDNGILIGDDGDRNGPHIFSNSPTTILTDPNDIRNSPAVFDAPGRVSPTDGINSDACFIISNPRPECAAAAWGPDLLVNNMGRLVIYGDIDSQDSLTSDLNGQQFENIRSFLLAGFSGGGDVCDENPNLPGCEDNGGGDNGGDNRVPTPGTLGLLGLGLIGVAYSRKRKTK